MKANGGQYKLLWTIYLKFESISPPVTASLFAYSTIVIIHTGADVPIARSATETMDSSEYSSTYI